MQPQTPDNSSLSHLRRLAVPIGLVGGLLGGLIDLDGAEFRLPVLAGPLR